MERIRLGGTDSNSTRAASISGTSYEWLVVAGARAQFKGTGTINGSGSYQFLLTGVDGQVGGHGDTDAFRIKITGPGGVVYDNNMGSSDAGNDGTELAGGNIHISSVVW